MWDPYAEYEKTVLPNGLSVYCAQWPKRPWVAMSFFLHSGARVDGVGTEGTSHFVEHLVSRNQSLSYQEIKDHFENAGGKVELGVTSYQHTYYQFFSSIKQTYFSKSLEIFGNMLLASSLKDFIEEQRKVIFGEYQKKFSKSLDVEHIRRGRKNVFRESWLERFLSPLGDKDSIARIKPEDLQVYFDSYYTPGNLSIVCTGGLKSEELIEFLLDSPFAINKQGDRPSQPSVTEDIPLPYENLFVFETSKHIQMEKPLESAMYESTCRLPGSIRSQVVGVVIGMLNELLFSEIREKRGWTYGISVSTHSFIQFHVVSVHSSGLSLVAIDKIDDLVTEIILSLPQREELFRKTINRKIEGYTMIDRNAKSTNESIFFDLERHDRILPNSEEENILRAMTLSDVENLIQWMRPQHRWTFITVP